MYPYQRLRVWQRAHALAVALYDSQLLDESPKYAALVDQIRRSAGSVASNIAEGSASGSQASFARYLAIAIGSAHELEGHLRLAADIGCTRPDRRVQLAEDVESIKKMLTVLRRTVKLNPDGRRKADASP